MNLKPLKIIIAVDNKNGFARGNEIPWFLPEDLRFFQKQTTRTIDSAKQNAVIFGRVTFETIPKQHRPLKNRRNLIVSKCNSQMFGNDNIDICDSFESAHILASESNNIEDIYICGGEALYNWALASEYCDTIYVTRIQKDYQCDRFLDPIKGNWKIELLSEFPDAELPSRIFKYTRSTAPHPEFQYLNLIDAILKDGEPRQDRTGTGTLATFGQRMEFDLEVGFPLLTTKLVSFKTVLRELLWIIAGDTNAKHLQEKGVHIWDGNTSREFLDANGLSHLPEGDIGELYGHFWRHWGAEYTTCNDDYTGKGIDQLQKVIEQIKNNPHSRRHVVTAWNPSAEGNQVLTACHCLFQFYVSSDGRLSCQLTQRSADFALGIPYNIASYSLLIHMVAHICGLKPGKFIHIMGDTHIYNDHIESLRQQIQRTPRPFPILKIDAPDVKTIDDFKEEMFSVLEYNPHPKIVMQMSA